VAIAGGSAGAAAAEELKEEDMDLIARYIEEVGRFLPRKLRSDVQQELRSTLEDSLEGRLADSEEGDAEAAQVELLRELGHPEELATSYLPEPRYLIGPRLYPGFQLTMRICLLVLAVNLLLGVVATAGDNGGSQTGFLTVAIALVDDYLATALTILGIVVFIFAVIERFARPWGAAREWDPRSLPDTDDPDRVGRLGQGVKLAFLGLALVAINFFPDRIGSFVRIGEQSGWVPMMGPAASQHLWLLNLALGLDLLLNLVVWRQGRWQLKTRWLDFGTTLIWVLFLYRLVTGPSIVEADAEWMIAHGWSAEAAAGYVELMGETLSGLVEIALRIGLVAALVGAAIQFFGLVKKTLQKIF
jgi:hypothetical protein